MKSQQPKLIILRGPSGAGKSTVAHALRRKSARNIVIVEQDYYRHELLNDQPDEKNIVPELVFHAAMTALHSSYDVIVEGIFRKEKYAQMFEKMLRKSPGETYVYYFDIPFDETARRHETREKSALFSAEEMKQWYAMAEPLGFAAERHVSASATEAETIERILREAAL